MNESNLGFDCDRYTNASLKKNLELASAAARMLGQPLVAIKDGVVRGHRRTFPVASGSAP